MTTHRSNTGSRVRRGLAGVAALTVAGWGATTLPAFADPGNGNGNGSLVQTSNGTGAPQSGQHGNAGTNGNAQAAHTGNGGKNDHAANGAQGSHGQGPGSDNGHHYGQTGQGPAAHGGSGQAQGQAHGQAHGAGAAGHGSGGSGGGHSDPPGNNGTVKITPHLEDDGIPQNTPHVSCTFDVEWYGFDEGADIISTVTFTPQAPTSDVVISGTEPSQVFVGGDPASGAGTDSGFDGEATYTLGFTGTPHPKQGYHVKLTVHTPGSQGSDTKTKVFWVEPCGETPVTPSSDVPAAPEQGVQGQEVQGQGVEGVQQGATDTGETAPQEQGVMGIQAQAGAGVAGQQAAGGGRPATGAAQGADVPTSVAAGEDGGFMGSPTSFLALMLLVGGLALGGAALVLRRRAHLTRG